jgi:hypothetical protein
VPWFAEIATAGELAAFELPTKASPPADAVQLKTPPPKFAEIGSPVLNPLAVLIVKALVFDVWKSDRPVAALVPERRRLPLYAVPPVVLTSNLVAGVVVPIPSLLFVLSQKNCALF